MDLYFFPDLIHDFFVDFNFGILFLFLFLIIVYIVVSWLLSDMNQLLYGKKNVIAWIPVANVYLLGELILSKPVGYALSGGLVLITLLNIFIDSNSLISILSIIYFLILLGSIGYAIYKYFDLRKSAKNSSMVTNTLNLNDENNELSPTKTNGPSESLINSINIIPPTNVNNINTMETVLVNSLNDNPVSKEINQLPVNNVNLVTNNIPLENTNNVTNSEEKHYEMPKLILEASNSSDKREEQLVDNKFYNEEERMQFVTGENENNNDENMKFVTGNENTGSTLVNMIPVQEEITVVNGVVSSPNESKNEELEKMNIVNGTIIPNLNTNNQPTNTDSVLDLNKKL